MSHGRVGRQPSWGVLSSTNFLLKYACKSASYLAKFPPILVADVLQGVGNDSDECSGSEEGLAESATGKGFLKGLAGGTGHESDPSVSTVSEDPDLSESTLLL